VKRYKASGRIKAVAAQLDPDTTGKPLLAFVHVTAHGWGKTPELLALADLPEVEEVHSVTGVTCLMFKVRTASAVALEALLAKIYAVPNVTATKSYVVLSTYQERPVQIGVTEDLNAPFNGCGTV
jgi:DNA-binding Lrp family transcriptional regulator